MYSDSNRTQFISGKKDNSEVVVHSFEQKKYEYTRKQTMEVDAKLEGQVSALCHEPQNNKIISGSDCGQITLADAATGDFISSGKLANSSDDIEGPPINNFAVCPTNPHVAMAACSATTKQIRIFDLRMPISTVLSLGLKSINEYSADIKPAWDPDNGVIAVPFNRHDTGYEDDIIVTADTRFAKYQYERPELHIPLDTGIWSISFDGKDENGTKKMVTAGDNGTIGIFDCFNICTYDDSNNECFDRSSDGDNSEEYDEEYDDYNYYEN
ncbi:hypothetical protein IW150_003483 [Coemansia sp. RSA 2607]|nr:hypothetical protein IW150_003483 [Coemansia sp. RSA 2607]